MLLNLNVAERSSVTDTIENSDTASAPAVATKKKPGLTPASANEIPAVHQWLMEAIETSPFYNDEFKAYEKERLTEAHLRRLHAHDPAHIMMMRSGDEAVGFMISGPELGTLWLYWSYLLPEKRRGAVAVAAMRNFVEYWDNGRFHKIATYTKEGNAPAEAIMKRYGFSHTCTLEKHIFGEDYHLYERPLTKIIEGYDHGISGGTMTQVKQTVKKIFGL